MKKAVIIGAGPAGISAALYTARANIDTTVITGGPGALEKAEKIENYYGFAEPISGAQLEQNGIAGAKRLGVQFVFSEVVSLDFDGGFTVQTVQENYRADTVLLATGSRRIAPAIPGLTQLEGKGVSYCAVCDAFFYRGKPVAVLGNGEFALHEAQTLLAVASGVTILTDGAAPTADFGEAMPVVQDKISAFNGTQRLESVAFENGEKREFAGVFVAYGTATTVALAKKLGAATDGNRIKVDETMQTSVKGLYAAGDCTGGLLQVSKAVYEGARAGTEMIRFLRQ